MKQTARGKDAPDLAADARGARLGKIGLPKIFLSLLCVFFRPHTQAPLFGLGCLGDDLFWFGESGAARHHSPSMRSKKIPSPTDDSSAQYRIHLIVGQRTCRATLLSAGENCGATSINAGGRL